MTLSGEWLFEYSGPFFGVGDAHFDGMRPRGIRARIPRQNEQRTTRGSSIRLPYECVIDVNANPHDSNVRKGEDSDVSRREDAMKRFLRWRQVKGVLRIGYDRQRKVLRK